MPFLFFSCYLTQNIFLKKKTRTQTPRWHLLRLGARYAERSLNRIARTQAPSSTTYYQIRLKFNCVSVEAYHRASAGARASYHIPYPPTYLALPFHSSLLLTLYSRQRISHLDGAYPPRPTQRTHPPHTIIPAQIGSSRDGGGAEAGGDWD